MRNASELAGIPFDGAPSSRNMERARFDARVREYQVVREIGRGGMGVVFLARDVRLQRLVAIKVLRHELACCEDQRERFRREARLTARLHDDGIVAVHGFDERDDLVFIVMEFVRGMPLSARLKSQGCLPAEEARSILVALARTLDHTHSRGIVHRDLKPENVLLEAETRRARLTDFGVALTSSMRSLPSEANRAYGTPHFMSPEQAAGETDLDGRSDIYSLGVLGYLMLSGRVPFEGDDIGAIVSRQITEAHRPLREAAPKAPSELTAVIERCLKKEPGRRWNRAREVAEAMNRPTGRLSALRLVSSIVRSA